MRLNLSLLLLTFILAACFPATPPPPITADLGSEFTLAPEQTASITETELTIRLVAVSGDDRCPINVECYATGPVTFTLSVQMGSASPTDFVMQTFTGYDGRAPDGPFEGIQDRIEAGGYLIRVVAVLPHPQGFGDEIKSSEYRVTFLVTIK